MHQPLLTAYHAMPEPRRVAALGDCALGRKHRGTQETHAGPLDTILPIGIRIPGCPPTPQKIAQALLDLIDRPENTNG
jgi:Ni,Fe-hydrogenase III small subunit